MANGGFGDGGATDQPKEAEMPIDLATMPPASTEITDLVERLRTGRCVLCAGSRLTAADGERSFRSLVEKLLASLPEGDADGARQVLESRPLAAAGFVRRRLGEERFADALKKAAAPFAELPETIRLLGELPFRAIVTTAYDDAFERAFTKDGVVPRIYTPRDHEALKNDGKLRFVFKALGDPSRADSIVWSAEDLNSALADGGYRTVAQDLYRSRSFLFVGFDGRDPDLAMLLERVLAGARAGEVEHFAVMPGVGAVEKEELYAAYRIRVLSAENVAELARQLKDAVGEAVAPALPDDDDFEGWLALLGEGEGETARADAPSRATVDDKLDALTGTLRAEKDWEKLVDLLLGRVGVEPTVERRAEMLLEVARIFEHEVGDLSKAFTALVAAYKEHPQAAAWSELERLAQATGLWSDLLSELAEVMPTLPDGERAQAWLELARLYGDKLNAAEYALQSLDEALKLEPALADAAELRITLYKRLERWTELHMALGDAGRFVEQAEVLESRLGDTAQAAAAYRQALAKEPTHHEARAALEALLRRAGEWRALAAVLDERVEYATGEEARALRSEAAALFADKLDERKGAIERYEALAVDDSKDLDGAARARAALLGRRAGGGVHRHARAAGRGGRAAIASARRCTVAWRRCGRRSPARRRRPKSAWRSCSPSTRARKMRCARSSGSTTPSASGPSSSTPAVATRRWCRRRTPARSASRWRRSTSTSCATGTRRSTPTSKSRRICRTTATRWRRSAASTRRPRRGRRRPTCSSGARRWPR